LAPALAPPPAFASSAALLDHAAGLMAAEVDAMGEMMLQLGLPGGGWGPAPLTAAGMAAVVERLRADADAAGAELTILRERPLPADALAAGGDGGKDQDVPAAAAVTAAAPAGGGGADTPDAVPTAAADTAAAAAAGGSAAAQAAKGEGFVLVDALVRQRPKSRPALEVRVAVVGNVDSGKSTLVGVLTRGALDDGRGLARSKVGWGVGVGGWGVAAGWSCLDIFQFTRAPPHTRPSGLQAPPRGDHRPDQLHW
jgi:hypothetical protein